VNSVCRVSGLLLILRSILTIIIIMAMMYLVCGCWAPCEAVCMVYVLCIIIIIIIIITESTLIFYTSPYWYINKRHVYPMIDKYIKCLLQIES
jgi:hypothetical protein